jgi:hypothetical protein
MPAHTNGKQLPFLTAYEREQIQEIAEWKSTEPSRLTQAVDAVTLPIAWGVKRVVPRDVVRKAIDLLDKVSSRDLGSWRKAHLEDGSWDLEQLRQGPLEECDQLALELIVSAEHTSAGRGLVVRQLGNAIIGRVPFQLIAAFALIAKVGHCYGYPLNRPIDRAMLLDLLELSFVEQPAQRVALLDRLNASIEHPNLESLDADALAVTAGRDVVADELADELVGRIPVLGSLIGFVTDRTFIQTAGESAMRFFQERHLRDNGKVTSIPPSEVRLRKSSLSEVGNALGQTIYAGGAIVGFTATFPVVFVGRMLSWWQNPVTLGSIDGSAAAVRSARGIVNSGTAALMERLTGNTTSEEADSGESEPLPASIAGRIRPAAPPAT